MNITAAICMHARLRPRAPAVIAPRRSLNFAQLDAAIWRAAVHFRATGLEAGQVVMLDIGESIRHLIVALALARIGVAHLAKPVRQAESVMAPLMARVKAVRTISGADAPDDILFGTRELKRESINAIAAGMTRHGALPWYYITSSGTTGRPKLSSITHTMSFQRLTRYRAGLPMLASDRHMPLSEMAFSSSKGRTANTLNVGGCVVFADGLAPDRIPEFIRRARVTRINCVPIHLHMMFALAERHASMLLPELRALEVLGSTADETLRRRIREKVSQHLYVTYSTTESGVVSVAPPEAQLPDTVGYLLPEVHLQIVDDADRLLPRGEIGIIRIRAPGAVASYHDDAEATAKAYRSGWFYPGDLGALTDDEQLIFRGRADDMMLHDGINIYPAEIEGVLATHEAVSEVAACALESESHQDVPVAAVILRTPIAESELDAYCRARLGQRSPKRVFIVSAFPRNVAGKVLKRELTELLQRQATARLEGSQVA